MSAFGFLAAIPLFLWSVDVEPHTKGWFITTRFWFSVRTRAVRSRDNLRLNIIVARNKIPDFNVFVEYVQRYRNGYAVRKITGTQVSFFSFFFYLCVCEFFFRFDCVVRMVWFWFSSMSVICCGFVALTGNYRNAVAKRR